MYLTKKKMKNKRKTSKYVNCIKIMKKKRIYFFYGHDNS